MATLRKKLRAAPIPQYSQTHIWSGYRMMKVRKPDALELQDTRRQCKNLGDRKEFFLTFS